MKSSTGKIYSFGKFRVDARERLLFEGSVPVSLTPKAFDTRLLLIENSGHALSKEEIMQTVWADSFVEENNPAQNISLLRRVLGESKSGAKFIETVSKRGYRFIAPVQIIEDEIIDSITVERTRAGFTIEEEIDDENFSETEISQSNLVQSSLPPSQSNLALPVFKPETHYVRNGDVNIAYRSLAAAIWISFS